MSDTTITEAPDSATVQLMTDLARDLTARNYVARQLQNYYDGAHPMPWVNRKAASEYEKLVQQAVTDIPVLIVDTLNDRLSVQGFRAGGGEADRSVWQGMWQPNNLDVFQPMVHQEAMCTGVSYVSTWPTSDGRAPVRVRGESSFEVIHEVDPGDPLKVRSALKSWVDVRRQRVFVRLFQEDVVTFLSCPYATYEQIVSKNITPDTIGEFVQSARWDVEKREGNPFDGRIPIVPFLNRARMDGSGRSEYAELIPLFDRLNTIAANMLLVIDVAGFKIRWATGIDIPKDANGASVEPFKAAVDRLWVSENPDAKFGQFDASPLAPYLEAATKTIEQIAAISRTPPFLLLGNLTNLSADALKATESGQVQKARNRMRVFAEAWEDVVDLYRIGIGQAVDEEVETIWADPENVSEAQRVDALVKLNQIGLPRRAVWERWGASPTEIERWEAMHWQERLEQAMQEFTIGSVNGEAAGSSAPVEQEVAGL